ncbi:MAG: serine/threonine protein kinase [Myxococcales bacterium]|nr:serine/threonine protein kinase [Myxococcales bacterium]
MVAGCAERARRPVSAAADSNPPGELYCTACEKTFHTGERCPTDGTRLLRLKARIDPFLGRDLDGRYTVLEKLGSGGMGAVYRAEQHSVDREVAIKVINSTLVSEPEVIKRFLREAKLATRFSHPNAVTVLDFGQTEDGVFFLVMELVAGRTLDEVIKSEKVFKAERLVRIGIQICDALEGAHALNIIHRDLKPSNIMLLSTGRDFVKVLDFGLAKSTAPDQTSTTMTGAGAVVGTPAFMPPELATGEPCDARSDLYSLGVVLYLLGSGRLPFVSESVHELLAMHASADPAPPMTGVPAKLARVIDKLIAKNPGSRYQNAHEAREALEDALVTTTPAAGVPVYPDDTNPSLGPFPATTQQFAHLETPVPPSLVAEQSARSRQKPSTTAMQKIMTGETMLASAAVAPASSPSSVSSQPGLASEPGLAPRRSRAPLYALVGGGLAVAVAVIVFATRGGDQTEATPPAEPPVVESVQPPAADPKPPAVPEPPVVESVPPAADPKPPAADPTPPATTEPKPPTRTTKGSRGSKGTKGTTTSTGAGSGAQTKPPESGTSTKPPAGAGSGSAKPPALPF